ncbi:MAG: hypothetical protein V1809_14410 [Planctomycetota bacterium]
MRTLLLAAVVLAAGVARAEDAPRAENAPRGEGAGKLIPWESNDTEGLRLDARRDGERGEVRIASEGGGDAMEWRVRIEAKLEESVSFKFENMSLEDAIKFFHDVKGLNFVIDPEVLAANPSPINLEAKNIKVRSALNWIARLSNIAYRPVDGVVYFANKEKLKGEEVIRHYDVRDLLLKVPDYPGPDINLSAGGGATGTPLFPNAEESDKSEPMTSDELVDMVKKNVAPESWQ